jgi:hypothetical protein
MSESRENGQMSHAPGSPDLGALAALVEGSLERSERQRLEEHLSECAECRGVLAMTARGAAGAATAVFRTSPVTGWLAAAAGLVIATVVGVRVASTGASRPHGAPPEAGAPAPPEASAAEPRQTALPSQTDRPRPSDETLLLRRSGSKTVTGKTFRLVAGEWMDRDYDPLGELPEVIATGPVERKDLLEQVPDLAPYAALGDRVVVVHRGTVYRFRPAPK